MTTPYTFIYASNLIGDYLLALIILCCGLIHLAILRTPDIPETFIGEAMRRVKITGYLLTAIWWWYVLFAFGDLPMQVVPQIGLTFVFGAEFYKCLYVLFKHKINQQPLIKDRQDVVDAEDAVFARKEDDVA